MASGVYQIFVNVKFLHLLSFIKSNSVALTLTAHHNFKVPHMYSYHIIILSSQ